MRRAAWVALGLALGTTAAMANIQSVTPNSGSGSPQTFTVTATGSPSRIYLYVGNQSYVGDIPTDSCLVSYTPSSNVFDLTTNGYETVSWFVGGSGNSAGDGPCSLASTSSGSSTTVNFAMGFGTSFYGSKHIWAWAEGSGGWQDMGTWGVPPLWVAWTSPSSASGTSITFTGSIGNAVNDFGPMLVQFAQSLNTSSYANSCVVSMSGGYPQLYNDAGTTLLAPGQSNSQCTLSTSYSGSS